MTHDSTKYDKKNLVGNTNRMSSLVTGELKTDRMSLYDETPEVSDPTRENQPVQ